MTKAQLAEKMANETGLSILEATAAIESFMNQTKKALTNGDNVYLRGFGSFIVKERAKKLARNINKGTEIIVPAHCIPDFKPAPDFKNSVKANVPAIGKRP